MLVSDDFFRILGVRPLIGRGFLPGENQVGATRVAVLGYGFWVRRSGSDAGIVGRPVQLDGQSVMVVGVMPGNLNYPAKDIDVWMPMQMLSAWPPRDPRSNQFASFTRSGRWLRIPSSRSSGPFSLSADR